MHIDQLLQQSKDYINGAETSPLMCPDHWTQGRTAFGGLSAALLYAAIKEKVEGEGNLLSITFNFVGPLDIAQAIDIKVDTVRAGKNVVQMQGQLYQGDKIALTASCCFGQSRESKITVHNQDQHDMTVPDKGNFIPQVPKVVPKFLRHFELSFQQGKAPFTGGKRSNYKGWMRFKKAPEIMTDAHVIALIDSWPPPVLQLLRWPAPASTVTWNIEFIHPHRLAHPTDWYAYDAVTRQAGEGYAHAEANIWDQAGNLVALSRQVYAVFA